MNVFIVVISKKAVIPKVKLFLTGCDCNPLIYPLVTLGFNIPTIGLDYS